MAATIADFRSRFPEFASDVDYPDGRVQLFLTDAQTLYMGTGETRWGNRYNIAQAYLAAHLLYTAEAAEAGDASATVGAISSKSVDGVSVSRAVTSRDNSFGDDALSTTYYGQQYLVIRNNTFIGIVAAVV